MGDGRQGGHEAGQHPQCDQQRDGDVRDEVHLHAAELLEVQRAGGVGGDGEHPVRRELHDEPCRAGDQRAGDAQHVEQHLLPLDADQGDPEDDRKQDDGRDDAVGERVERVRRDVEPEEVEGLRLLDERRAEERRLRACRKREREDHRESERHDPQQGQHRPGPEAEPLRFRGVERPEARDDRDRDVGQDRHLQQPDEAVRDDLDGRDEFSEEEPGREARHQADEDLARERHGRVSAQVGPAVVRTGQYRCRQRVRSWWTVHTPRILPERFATAGVRSRPTCR